MVRPKDSKNRAIQKAETEASSQPAQPIQLTEPVQPQIDVVAHRLATLMGIQQTS